MALPNQKTVDTLLSELALEVLGKSSAATTDRPSAALFLQFLNDSHQEVCAMHDWWWLYRESTFNTVQGQTTPYYPITSPGMHQVEWMTIPDQQVRLAPKSMRDWTGQYPGGYTNVGSGRPSFYVESYNDSSNQLGFLLGPGPCDSVYTVKFGYKLAPAALTTGSGILVVPAAWQDLVKLQALVRAYRFLGPGSAERLRDAKAEFQRVFDLAWLDDQRQGEFVRSRRDSSSDLAGYQASLNSVLWNG